MNTEQIKLEVASQLKTYEPTRANGVLCGPYNWIRPVACAKLCETRCMNGRSWWKLLGYNFSCGCAWDALEVSLTKTLVDEEKRQKAIAEKNDREKCHSCQSNNECVFYQEYNCWYCVKCDFFKRYYCYTCEVLLPYKSTDDLIRGYDDEEEYQCASCFAADVEDDSDSDEEDNEDNVFIEMDRDERKCQIQDWQKQLVKLARDAGIPEEIYNMGATSDVDELYDLIWGKEDPTHKHRND